MIRWSYAWAIIRREYMARVRTRAFWLSTILVPLLLAAITVLPTVLAKRQQGNLVLGLQDQTGRIRDLFMERLATSDDGRLANRIQVVDIPAGMNNGEMTAMVTDGKIDGYVVIGDEEVRTGNVTYRAAVTTNIIVQSDLQDLLTEVFAADRLRARGLDAALVRELSTPAKLKAADISGEAQAAGEMRFVIAYGLFFVLYFLLLLYGQNVMSGVLEEKTSRIVEVIISSVRPAELMMGKIIGIGGVGLTQILVWLLAATVFAGGAAASALPRGVSIPELPPALMLHFVFYFITGFLLYSTLYAFLGAMNNSEQEARQMIMLVTMPLVIPALFLMPVVNAPRSTLAIGLSIFPLFTPLLMMARIAVGAARPLEIVVANVLLLATLYVEILIVGRVYRVGILMYGKRPTIPEILRWARYK